MQLVDSSVRAIRCFERVQEWDSNHVHSDVKQRTHHYTVGVPMFRIDNDISHIKIGNINI